MNKYGDTAILATVNIDEKHGPRKSWQEAAEAIFKESPSARKKGCPRSTFLGLCEEGQVRRIPAGNYTSSKENKKYALRAIQLLRNGVGVTSPVDLWKAVLDGDEKSHNGQMYVVLALWENGYIEEA